MNTSDSFREIVRARRLELDLSMRQCARELGVSVVYWSDVERGRRDPYPKETQLQRVSDLLNLDFEQLSDAAKRDRKVVQFDLAGMDQQRTELVLRFARLWSDLDTDEIEEIDDILERHREH